MFNKARLKLTAWYLLIIMFVSISFSAIIYRNLSLEVERFARVQRVRIFRNFNQPLPFPAVDIDLVQETKQRIILFLAVINAIIFLSAGGLGYFLAGKTLQPIARMVEEQNRFISDASHELKTPLTSLKTAMEVGLRDKKLNLTAAKKLISENLTEINKLQSLSEGLLQLAQHKTGNNNLKFEKLSLRKIVTEAVSKINVIAKEKKVAIKNKVKNYKVKGNKYSLMDLFVIILDNAVKYSKTNSPVAIEANKKNKTVIVSIVDRGIGIDKEDLPHVFNRFYRADRARGKGGYGLGLAIAKKIIENHNGTVEIESELGKGTIVKVSLPLFS